MKNQNVSLKKLISTQNYDIIREKMKDKKTQSVTMAILSLLTLSLFGFFAISPTLSTIAQLNRQLDDKKDIDRKLNQKIQNISSLQQQYATIQADLPLINAALPQRPEASYLLGQLDAIAKNFNITISQIQVSSVSLSKPKSTKTIEFPFSISASGTKENMSSFIQEISFFDRIVVLDQIAISQDETLDQDGKITLQGNGFYKK